MCVKWLYPRSALVSENLILVDKLLLVCATIHKYGSHVIENEYICNCLKPVCKGKTLL